MWSKRLIWNEMKPFVCFHDDIKSIRNRRRIRSSPPHHHWLQQDMLKHMCTTNLNVRKITLMKRKFPKENIFTNSQTRLRYATERFRSNPCLYIYICVKTMTDVSKAVCRDGLKQGIAFKSISNHYMFRNSRQ